MTDTIGANIWSGTATIPAAGPGQYGEVEIDVGSAGLAAADKVVASISHTESQNTSNIINNDFNFQIIKNATGDKIVFKSTMRQNPEVKVDFFVVGNSTV